MAPYDNLPYFRSWLEANIGHTSKTRNDMLILGDFLRYFLTEARHLSYANFHVKYRDQEWFISLSATPNTIPPNNNDIIIELTDAAISSVLAQCAFNEGSVLRERERTRETKPTGKEG